MDRIQNYPDPQPVIGNTRKAKIETNNSHVVQYEKGSQTTNPQKKTWETMLKCSTEFGITFFI
jgi:hypothetical protein